MKQYKAQNGIGIDLFNNLVRNFKLYFIFGDLVLVGWGVFVGNLTIGTVTIINYQSMLVSPLTFLQNLIIVIRVCGYETSSTRSFIKRDGRAEQLEETIKKIEFSNTAFKYLKSDEIIKDVNIKLEKGNIYGFIGGSGCGKSTVVKLL